MPEAAISCSECGEDFTRHPELLASGTPCPRCGSRNRSVHAADTITIHERVDVKATRPGEKKPHREIRSGDDLHRATGRWNVLRRLIDRDADTYEERIVDPETGAVLRNVKERLSQHRGRGSAKRTRSST